MTAGKPVHYHTAVGECMRVFALKSALDQFFDRAARVVAIRKQKIQPLIHGHHQRRRELHPASLNV